MDTSGHNSNLNDGTSGGTMITFKDLEQNLIEQITISVLNHQHNDVASVDSGFQVGPSRARKFLKKMRIVLNNFSS